MAAMFDPISRGDPNVIDDYFGKSRNAPFQWFSMTATGTGESNRQHFVAYNLHDLAAYFSGRHEHNERLKLKSIEVNGFDAARGIVQLGPFALTRRADDLQSRGGSQEHQVVGKAAYDCATQAFVVFSLAMNTEPS